MQCSCRVLCGHGSPASFPRRVWVTPWDVGPDVELTGHRLATVLRAQPPTEVLQRALQTLLQ